MEENVESDTSKLLTSIRNTVPNDPVETHLNPTPIILPQRYHKWFFFSWADAKSGVGNGKQRSPALELESKTVFWMVTW